MVQLHYAREFLMLTMNVTKHAWCSCGACLVQLHQHGTSAFANCTKTAPHNCTAKVVQCWCSVETYLLFYQYNQKNNVKLHQRCTTFVVQFDVQCRCSLGHTLVPCWCNCTSGAPTHAPHGTTSCTNMHQPRTNTAPTLHRHAPTCTNMHNGCTNHAPQLHTHATPTCPNQCTHNAP